MTDAQAETLGEIPIFLVTLKPFEVIVGEEILVRTKFGSYKIKKDGSTE